MPNYLVGVYQEKFGTVLVRADNHELAAEKVEEVLTEHEDISTIPTFDEQSAEKGVAIDAKDFDNLQIAVTEIVNDS